MDQKSHRADASALLDERGYTGPLIKGQNPALLMEKAVRDRITASLYWREQCYGLNAASLCDRAVELNCVGGTFGDAARSRPTPFLCLVFKMLQLVPEREIVLEYLNFQDREEDEETQKETAKTSDFKYLRALAAFYIRLTWEPVEVYKTLEPLLADYRKMRMRLRDSIKLTHMDQFVWDLLTKDRLCSTSLWKLPARVTLEDLDLLEPRESPLGEELDELEAEQDDNGDDEKERSMNGDRSSMGSRESRSRSGSRSESDEND